ncbi:O-acyltransferase WSD1 [Vitis vinifera]|uniref:O-acyltransferase WSD1 n=1 Tax=Vitis vinifera TaxID=29760 RepID=A0A438EGV5_VITVI|nr:O-acyltransferase WSD1 [Vitis vinifera]
MEYLEHEKEEEDQPVSPTGQYFNSSVLQISIMSILELDIPIDDSPTLSLLKDVFLPINPRFSSLMVEDKNGVKHWKRVEVKLEDHVNVPIFPDGLSPESYDDYFDDYLTKIAMKEFPQSRPLWEIHIIKYPTSNAAGTVVSSNLDSGRSIIRAVPRALSAAFNTVSDFGWGLLKSTAVEDNRTPIRSGDPGVEFRPLSITTISFSLDNIQKIKAKLGVTINDVLTGIIFFGTRLYMQSMNHASRNANSTALVLLNTRVISGYKSLKEMTASDSSSQWGNQFAFLHVTLPELADAKFTSPLDFVAKAQQTIQRKRNSLAVHLTGRLLETLRKYRGPEVTARYIHGTLKNSSMTISNMIGPMEQVALANHPCRGMYFMTLGSPESMTISILSYMGKVRITVGTEKGFIDPRKFNACIEDAFQRVFEAAVGTPPPPMS